MLRSEKIKVFVIAFLLGISGGFVSYLVTPAKVKTEKIVQTTEANSPNVTLTNGQQITELPDFTQAAEKGLNAVVHIRTEYYNQIDDPVYNFFFGRPNLTPAIEGTGSGVIISKDGYIVTNNHVIDKATHIVVTLNDKREFDAKLIGKDPTTDIALLKIDADSLPTIPFGNSDDIKVGQWVLAIGNPFNLTSTVTAGIVSAKGRNIHINDRRYAIESFIQTDAAVNPGNSGGALINTKGELIGINTAIASPTGTFAGYSFAIPVSIVQKVVADIIEYGSPQRAYLGVNVADISDKIAETFDIADRNGVFVTSVKPDGAADKAGIKEGDIIKVVDGKKVASVSELLEQIAKHRPGDEIAITVKHKNTEKTLTVTLTNEYGTTKPTVKNTTNAFGASFEDLTKDELNQYGIKYGVRVSDVMSGKFLSAGIRPGFVIIKINDKPAKSSKQVSEYLSNIHGGVYIEGIYPDTGMRAYYAFGVK